MGALIAVQVGHFELKLMWSGCACAWSVLVSTAGHAVVACIHHCWLLRELRSVWVCQHACLCQIIQLASRSVLGVAGSSRCRFTGVVLSLLGLFVLLWLHWCFSMAVGPRLLQQMAAGMELLVAWVGLPTPSGC